MVKMVIENEYEETNSDDVNYKQEYRKLKRKLKLLIYVSISFLNSRKCFLLSIFQNVLKIFHEVIRI